MPYKTIDIDVEIDLEDFEDDELIDELRYRGIDIGDGENLDYNVRIIVSKIYELARNNKDYSVELSDLVYYTIGRIM